LSKSKIRGGGGLLAELLEFEELAEEAVELAVEAGFVFEEALELGTGGKDGFGAGDFEVALAGLGGEAEVAGFAFGAALGVAEGGGGERGLVNGGAAAAPEGEGHFPSEGDFVSACGVEAGDEVAGELLPRFPGFVREEDGLAGGDRGVHGAPLVTADGAD